MGPWSRTLTSFFSHARFVLVFVVICTTDVFKKSSLAYICRPIVGDTVMISTKKYEFAMTNICSDCSERKTHANLVQRFSKRCAEQMNLICNLSFFNCRCMMCFSIQHKILFSSSFQLNIFRAVSFSVLYTIVRMFGTCVLEHLKNHCGQLVQNHIMSILDRRRSFSSLVFT